MSKILKIYICAGEASGDLHGSALMRELKALYSGTMVFRGFGGDAMKAEGAELLYHTDQTGICGITPVIKELPFLLRMMKTLKRDILQWQPHLMLTIDYPGMNLRLADFAHRNKISTIHYICPQVWAWHRGRIPKLARFLDRLICIFPFEPAHFDGTDLDVVFTGHPLVDRAAETKAQIAPEFPWRGQHKIALLPGSRAGEISRILPRMLEAGARLEEKLSTESSFIIPAPTRGMLELARTIIDKSECKPRNLSLVEGQARALLLQADAAAVASGTATLEASLMRCPTVLVYCAGALTAVIARVLIKGVRFLGLANIIADKEVMPELLQESFTPENLAAHLHALLTDETLRRRTLTQLDAVNAMLGAGNAPARAAEAILDFISTHNKEKRMTGL